MFGSLLLGNLAAAPSPPLLTQNIATSHNSFNAVATSAAIWTLYNSTGGQNFRGFESIAVSNFAVTDHNLNIRISSPCSDGTDIYFVDEYLSNYLRKLNTATLAVSDVYPLYAHQCCYYGGHIYTVNQATKVVSKVSLAGALVASYTVTTSGTIVRIAADSSGVYLTVQTSNELIKLPLDLSSQSIIATLADIAYSSNISLSATDIYVVRRNGYAVAKVAKSDNAVTTFSFAIRPSHCEYFPSLDVLSVTFDADSSIKYINKTTGAIINSVSVAGGNTEGYCIDAANRIYIPGYSANFVTVIY